MARILTALLVVVVVVLAWQFVTALLVHQFHTWATFLANKLMILHLRLHPVLINTLWTGLWGALITAHGVPVLHLHLEHATLVFSRG